jgi:hypothetical protein
MKPHYKQITENRFYAFLRRFCDGPARRFQVSARLRGRADRAFPPSGLAKIFGDDAGVVSRHWLIFGDRFYQRAIRSEELVPIVALGVVEQVAQCLHREGLRLVHARNVLRHG